ncbi:hypothetical protein GBF38_020468 [Nibea albiflora]|uniref:Uncharacterized protein n=1 Tax=Nibea albiflora TaxID=240163 RepID=A0ACB7FE18_NIBAL|nr:hypothetical protein GBF38_020468 [Nibea albiflora]
MYKVFIFGPPEEGNSSGVRHRKQQSKLTSVKQNGSWTQLPVITVPKSHSTDRKEVKLCRTARSRSRRLLTSSATIFDQVGPVG